MQNQSQLACPKTICQGTDRKLSTKRLIKGTETRRDSKFHQEDTLMNPIVEEGRRAGDHSLPAVHVSMRRNKKKKHRRAPLTNISYAHLNNETTIITCWKNK